MPYWRLERVNERLVRLEDDMMKIHESAILFEVTVPEFKYLKSCRKDIRSLKVNVYKSTKHAFNYLLSFQQLWDHIFLVRKSVEHWKDTPWREVDVENMDIECKKFAKDIRCKFTLSTILI